MPATVSYPGEKPRTVKNLGWLLSNWQQVEEFFFEYEPEHTWDGRLIARLKGDGIYVTKYASLTVCFRWLHRPVFKTLPLSIKNKERKTTWTIGNAQYVETMKRDGGATVESYKAHLASLLP